MHSNIGQSNSPFQQRYFITGSCFTPDGAWALLFNQRQAALAKVRNIDAVALNREADGLEIATGLRSWFKVKRLRAEAKRIAFDAETEALELNAEGARTELAAIDELLAEVEPHRRYAHMSIIEASNAAQYDEWREELKQRAVNHLCGFGFIPADELKTMRMHPEFATEILPVIRNVIALKSAGKLPVDILANQPRPFLLEHTP